MFIFFKGLEKSKNIGLRRQRQRQNDCNQGRSTHEKIKKPYCSQIQIKNLESLSTALTIGGEIKGALCRSAIASHSIPVLCLATNVISCNTRASVSFFSST
jgi:hypothetical protein